MPANPRYGPLAEKSVSAQEFPAQFVIGLLLLAVVIGVVYNLWRTTRVYGGIIGQGLRLVGLGIIFLVVVALDRVVVAFTSQGALAALAPPGYESVVHDLLFVLALLFVTLGFAKFLHALRG